MRLSLVLNADSCVFPDRVTVIRAVDRDTEVRVKGPVHTVLPPFRNGSNKYLFGFRYAEGALEFRGPGS